MYGISKRRNAADSKCPMGATQTGRKKRKKAKKDDEETSVHVIFASFRLLSFLSAYTTLRCQSHYSSLMIQRHGPLHSQLPFSRLTAKMAGNCPESSGSHFTYGYPVFSPNRPKETEEGEKRTIKRLWSRSSLFLFDFFRFFRLKQHCVAVRRRTPGFSPLSKSAPNQAHE